MSHKKMKAALLYGIKDLRVEAVDLPSIDHGEVLVKIGAATTCGTDVKIYQRGYVKDIIKYPMIFGHEWAGEIVEVGDSVQGLDEGMRIRAGNTAPCFRCPLCREGKHNLCEDRTWLWGAYAEYIRVPPSIVRYNTLELPPQMTYEEAAMAEPLACVIHGVHEAGLRMGDTVVVLGSGPIGIMHAQVAKIRGARKVIVIDLVDERLGVAEELGADEIINPRYENPVDQVKRLTDGLGADVVIEAVGLPETWEQSLRFVKRGGTVLEFGGCPPGTEIKLETDLLHYGEVKLLGTFHAKPREFEIALGLIASETVKLSPLITKKMSLDEIKEAFRTLFTSKRDLKIAIIP